MQSLNAPAVQEQGLACFGARLSFASMYVIQMHGSHFRHPVCVVCSSFLCGAIDSCCLSFSSLLSLNL